MMGTSKHPKSCKQNTDIKDSKVLYNYIIICVN